jgi:glycosidase
VHAALLLTLKGTPFLYYGEEMVVSLNYRDAKQ